MRRFYHGTNIVIGDIDLSHSRSRTDFGKGFHTPFALTFIDQALTEYQQRIHGAWATWEKVKL